MVPLILNLSTSPIYATERRTGKGKGRPRKDHEGPEREWIRGEFRPRQNRQLPRAVDLKGRLLSCQSY